MGQVRQAVRTRRTAPASRAARAPATAGAAGELRLPAVVRGLSAHVVKTAKLPPAVTGHPHFAHRQSVEC
jgi:hypothetical protein